MYKGLFLVLAMFLVGCTGGEDGEEIVIVGDPVYPCEEDPDLCVDDPILVPTPLLDWSVCMDLEDLKSSRVARVWANHRTESGETCSDCHGLGGDGFIASVDADLVFESFTSVPELLVPYFTVNEADDIIVNRELLEAVGSQTSPHEAHPAFTVRAQSYAALGEFYESTTSRQAAGFCP